MVLAIAHVWMTEGLYDEEYVAERTVGFEKWKAYVLGEEDGVAKTPEWQEAETGVPARDVRALARAWGTKKTYLAAGGLIGFGGACRTATGTDWARGVVCLMAMQGLGKPGVNMGCLQQGTPLDTHFFFPGYAEGGYSGDLDRHRAQHQHVPAHAAARHGQHRRRRWCRASRSPRRCWTATCEALPHRPASPSRASSSASSTRRRATARSRCTTSTAARTSAP